ncbi:hypothetical protein GCM10025864_27250 [Luteimicrobium album]|uniref:DUF4386 family protein n=1 Tax=Luteimicrobium album TaxID=1054550 RepID=A0ABQ6I2R7_9MICO|nr:hypothetical protein [Luteimicrobium album]GMA24966.1 hypothetical protein GCM10025864_27250 [Luteimicrobium album]
MTTRHSISATLSGPAAQPSGPTDPAPPASASQRPAVAALAALGALVLLFPALRPWPDESVATPALARAMASDRWIVAHLCGAAAIALWPFAAAQVARLLPAGRAGRSARAAVLTGGAGAALVLPYFGAEIFAIHELAGRAVTTWDPTFLDSIDDIRLQPVAATMFGSGLLLLAASGVLLAVAWWQARDGAVRWAAVPLAAALVLFLPQFFAGETERVTHGALAGIAAWLLAAAVVRSPGTPAGRDA